MKTSQYAARVHVFVCANQRSADDPLGEGCGARGEVVFLALKKRARGRGDLWITKTHCLGLCPKQGCTVAIAPAMKYFVDVQESHVDEILNAAR